MNKKIIEAIQVTTGDNDGVKVRYKNDKGVLTTKFFREDLDYLVNNNIIKLKEWK